MAFPFQANIALGNLTQYDFTLGNYPKQSNLHAFRVKPNYLKNLPSCSMGLPALLLYVVAPQPVLTPPPALPLDELLQPGGLLLSLQPHQLGLLPLAQLPRLYPAHPVPAHQVTAASRRRESPRTRPLPRGCFRSPAARRRCRSPCRHLAAAGDCGRLVVVTEVLVAETGEDGGGAVVRDVSLGAGRAGDEGGGDGAQEDAGGEALPEGGRLGGGLPPGVHEAGLVTEARLDLGRGRPVELVAPLVGVEEGAARVALQPWPGGVEGLVGLQEVQVRGGSSGGVWR